VCVGARPQPDASSAILGSGFQPGMYTQGQKEEEEEEKRIYC